MTDSEAQWVGPGDVAEDDVPLIPEPSGWSDVLTGADGPRYWDRVLASEQARMRRHGGSATIVLVELCGFDELVPSIGRDGAVQAFARVSRVLARIVRSCDHIARIDTTRFGILLIATDEMRTLNFVDRMLRAVRREVDKVQRPIHVGVGWASPTQRETLSQAVTTAEARLETDFFQTKADAPG
jgi:diguanylate cyclase (GGDEF)-like protein